MPATQHIGAFRIYHNAGRITINAPTEHLQRLLPEIERLVQPSVGLRPALAYIQSRGAATSREVADALGLNISNASNKLKALQRDDYLVRRERSAATGGVEFEYALPED